MEGPHSRACGWRQHEHGPDCHSNCPTCGGIGGGPVAADAGAPLPPVDPGAVWQVPEVELVGMQPALHEPLKAAVGKHVTLHVQPGFGVTGTLSSYDEDTGVCLVTDRDRNYVAAGAVSVLQLRGTA